MCIVLLLLPLLSLYNIYMFSLCCAAMGNKINGESFSFMRTCGSEYEREKEKAAIHDFIKLK